MEMGAGEKTTIGGQAEDKRESVGGSGCNTTDLMAG